jgi:hypothetical protein
MALGVYMITRWENGISVGSTPRYDLAQFGLSGIPTIDLKKGLLFGIQFSLNVA